MSVENKNGFRRCSVPSQYLTTGDIARICDVTANGVIKWVKAGKLKAFRTPGGQRRVREEDFRDFAQKFNYPITTNFFKRDRKPRILIVDDNRDIVKLLKQFLGKQEEFDILSAHNGYEACIKAGSYRPEVMILDIMMPKVDGFEVLKQMQEIPETKGISIVIMSALDPATVRPRVSVEIPIFSKPIDLQALEAQIRSYITAAV